MKLYCKVDDKETQGSAQRRLLEPQERLSKALKTLGILWGIAILTVFIPILHFVTVPLFLLLGIVMAVLTWIEKAIIYEAEIPCPNCQHKVTFGPEAESLPKTMRCESCSFTLEIHGSKD